MMKDLQSQGYSDDDAFAFATAGLLQMYDAGVKLLQNEIKIPNVGTFKEIHATPQPNGIGGVYYKATKCK